MNKKICIALLVVLAVFAGIKVSLSQAQREPAQYGDDKALARIDSKLEELSNMAKENKEISRKLDLVLSNQEKILSEMEIVKVRASTKR